MSMTYDELYVAAERLAKQALSDAAVVTPEALGLDPRAAPALWAGEDFLAVRSMSRGTLDLYGAFGLTSAAYVQELGGFVFYSAEDETVARCLDQLDEIGE